MIFKNEIQAACDHFAKLVSDNVLTRTEAQLVSSLKTYIDRGEFDGSIESAIACLELAGYEVLT